MSDTPTPEENGESNPVHGTPVQGSRDLFDPKLMRDAGLTPREELIRQYADANAADALLGEIRTEMLMREYDQYQVILRKAKLGGLLLRLKDVWGYGNKGGLGELVGGVSDTTVDHWIDLYKYLPWAHATIRENARKAFAEGKETSYNTKEIVKIGKDAARKAGATIDPKRGVTGDGKAIIIDVRDRTVTYEDLPSTFKNPASVLPHWEKQKDREGKFGDMSLNIWLEVGGNATGYAIYNGMPIKSRAIIASLKGNKIFPLPDTLVAMVENQTNFNAREPSKVNVVKIDPEMGAVENLGVLDDFLKDSPVVAQLGEIDPNLEGCSLHIVKGNKWSFELGDREYKGEAVVVKTGDDGFLKTVPNNTRRLLLETISFPALDAMRPEKDGFVYLDPAYIKERWNVNALDFWERMYRNVLVASMDSDNRSPPTSRAEREGFAVTGDESETLWNVGKLDTLFADKKAQPQPETKAPVAEPVKPAEAPVPEPEKVPEAATKPEDKAGEAPPAQPEAVASDDAEIIEPEIVSYATMSREDRDHEDRQLASSLQGRLDLLERTVIGVINGPGIMDTVFKEQLQKLLPEVAEAKAELATLLTRFNAAKELERELDTSADKLIAEYIAPFTDRHGALAMMPKAWLRRHPQTPQQTQH